MHIDIHGDGWSAEIWHDDAPLAPYALLNVYAVTRGGDKELALSGAQWVLTHFAGGRLAYIRAVPEAESERNFDSKEVSHRGFVRFSYRPEPGEWHYPDPSDKIISLGSAA